MPLYELFCLAKSRLTPVELKRLMAGAGKVILDKGGIITDVKSFGEQRLAYVIRRPGERYATASMWQMTFASGSDVVSEVEHGLRLDEGVIRWAVLKRRKDGEALPTSYKIARLAEEAGSSSSVTSNETAESP
ncbi:37S ribosomal protein MRP17 [Picochlorum sp. SENEW3]|nr:37S ribosomal protein MRP17 [Picochlorum sp. SENEW3]WPT14615.1 37S ribosomal protein MRP17 [Picochlorum sp. SENEW3]